MSQSNHYKLELLKKDEESVLLFASLVLAHVKEAERRTVNKEANNIRRDYHVDHYFINFKDKPIGVVKTISGAFYYLGLPDDFDKDDLGHIINLIEQSIGTWRLNRIEATLHQEYLTTVEKYGYKQEFSRMKMVLKFNEVKNLKILDNLTIRTYAKGDLQYIIDMAGDAYRDGVDEQVGVFSGGIANTAIKAIMDGSYGTFMPSLTAIICAPGSNYIEGASLTTIAEGSPFVVLIGVRRAEQSKGYGRSLLTWVIQKSMAAGYDEIKLWVTDGNDNAIKLYKSLGFQEVSRIYSVYKII